MPLVTTEKGVVHGWLAGESGWAGIMNENLRRLSALGIYPYAVDPVASVFPDLVVRGSPIRLADGSWDEAESVSLELGDGATHYIERSVAGVVSSNTTGFTAGRIPIARVVTNAAQFQTIEDWRPPADLAIPQDGLTAIFKPTNQDVTDAGLTDDTALLFPVVAGARYLLEATLAISGNNATGDYTFTLAVSAGTMKGRGTVAHLSSALAVAHTAISASGTAALAAAVVCGTDADLDLPSTVRLAYAFTASADATFRLRFGNAAAAAGRTSRTWQGSIFRYRRIG